MKLYRSVLALVATFLLTGCQIASPAGARPGQIEHVVLVWLKQPGNMASKQAIAETVRSFPSRIDGIVALSIGEAVPSDRASDDDSFDLALVMRFADQPALAAYLTHPVHVGAVEQVLAPNAARVLVYDSRVW